MKLVITSTVFVLGILSFSVTAYTSNKNSVKTGKEIFERNCTRCHGAEGTKGMWGAKNLRVSTLSDIDLSLIIANGKKVMPAWKNSLTENELKLVRDYIKTLRK